eukprot:CAMPEP_0206438240 /NCGR_PEP_ID=MMETSP0324_2-20121206/11508_1 /ASSEMBLY_ACC=CAM_ASM_000836 /TAXON_ID=2866 /ORGANISM="Crypthecodinium cohnii, Strain Seligo" /LENGTH=142 /DNA_ID=CAMNT_0053905653 /DNA_START=222 /DNA_END=650 /DNA_ORIENTATION=+
MTPMSCLFGDGSTRRYCAGGSEVGVCAPSNSWVCAVLPNDSGSEREEDNDVEGRLAAPRSSRHREMREERLSEISPVSTMLPPAAPGASTRMSPNHSQAVSEVQTDSFSEVPSWRLSMQSHTSNTVNASTSVPLSPMSPMAN